MSEQTSTLRLIAQPSYGTVKVRHYSVMDLWLVKPFIANVVSAIMLPDGETIENPDHATTTVTEPTGEAITESITLVHSKAARLVDFFGKLKPGHTLECHDLVREVEGWEYDQGLAIMQKAVQPAGLVEKYEDVEPGNPYTVLIVRGTILSPDYGRSHSCIGTDEGRLLGLMGRGLALTTMDSNTAREVYASGSMYSFLAKTIFPVENPLPRI